MTSDQIVTATLYVQIALLLIQIPTLIALIVYVYKTWEMASATRKSAEVAEKTLIEMREQRDAEIAPYVIVYLDGHGEIDGLLYLVIKNTGKTVAKNVKVIFDPPLETDFPDLLQRVLPSDGIPSIPPNYEIKTTLANFLKYKKSRPMAFTVQVTYYGGISNKIREDKYHIDLVLFQGIVSSKETEPLSEEAKALQNIQSSSELIVDELQKMSEAISRKSKKTIRKRTSKKPV